MLCVILDKYTYYTDYFIIQVFLSVLNFLTNKFLYLNLFLFFLGTSDFIPLLPSWVTSPININEPVPEAAMWAQTMTRPPPCLTDELVCVKSWSESYSYGGLWYLHLCPVEIVGEGTGCCFYDFLHSFQKVCHQLLFSLADQFPV